jgi:hypothetical protein
VVPRRRRRPALVGAAVVVAVALAVGAAALVGVGDDDPTYSLVDAPAAVDELDGLHYEMTVAGLPLMGDVSLSATQDLVHERVELQMSLAEPSAGAVRMIGDLADGVVYLGGEVMADLLPDEAAWVRIDTDLMDELGGLEGWSEQLALDPLAALDTADLAAAVDEGFEDVDGIRTKRYSLTVDPLALLEQGGAVGDLGEELLAGLADEVEVLLWVDEDNLVRQLRHEIDLLGVTMTTTVRIDPTDTAVELPDPDVVVDGSEIIDLLR